MQETIKEELRSLEKNFLAAPRMILFDPSGWTDAIPQSPGVYAIWDRSTDKLVYVGETSCLRDRMKDLGRRVNHTCRRTLSKKLKLDSASEQFLSRAISKKYSLSYIEVHFGRTELEEYLVLRWRSTLINKRAFRLLSHDCYDWVKPQR
jgi:GIY-YIG catalytic domain